MISHLAKDPKLIGLVLSARLGNCYDFARYLLPEDDMVALGRLKLSPCSGCDYQCLRGLHCPIEDDLPLIYEKLVAADGILVFSPVYDGRPPALFYALEERLPSMWRRSKEGFNRFGRREVALVVVGNEGTEETLEILESTYSELGTKIIGTLMIFPKHHQIGGGIAGGLIGNLAIRNQLETLKTWFY